MTFLYLDIKYCINQIFFDIYVRFFIYENENTKKKCAMKKKVSHKVKNKVAKKVAKKLNERRSGSKKGDKKKGGR